MLHWDDLKYVLALKEHGNLVKAATQLKTNPTTVSRHIKRLSEKFDQTIFTRTGNGEWSITEEGREFAEAAKLCQSVIDNLGEGSREQKVREIKLTTTEFVAANVLAPRMNELACYGDGISLTLHTSDRNMSLAYGEADLAIRLARPETGRLVGSKIFDLTMGIYSKHGEPVENWIGLPSDYDWVPEMQLGLEHFGHPPSVRMGSFAAIRRTAWDCGLACIGPKGMMEGYCDLKQMKGSFVANREVWSVYHETKRNDPALASVRQWAKDCFAEIESPASEWAETSAKVAIG